MRSGSAPVTLAAMTLSASMILVDQTAVPLATADAISDLGGEVAQGQWILTANILPLAALLVFGGRLGDLLGLRRVFVAGAVIFVLGALACLVLVRRESRFYVGPVFSRRSRWTYATSGTSPAVTRRPPDSAAPEPPGDRSGSPPP